MSLAEGTARAKAPRQAWHVQELEEGQCGWSISRSGKIDAGGAQGTRQGQVIMRGFNFKSAKKPFKDFFFKQGRDMNRFAFLKSTVAAEGLVDVE